MINLEQERAYAYLIDPCFQIVNTAGKPLTGGYMEVYLHGTRTQYHCASDYSGTLHPFKIPLDSLGANIVLADPNQAYDVYIYNRFGNMIMSRYNVSPANGGLSISNSERIDELEELIVSAVTGLQGQIDDINDLLDIKKDKQEEYSITFSPTQTVSAITQDENGEINVIYQDIDLPEQVPNVDIVSIASTLIVSAAYDPETNTKTFNIDISDIGMLEYGQYVSNSFTSVASLTKIKGNIALNNGKLKLKKGNSYHITVRGNYTSNGLTNANEVLEYVEYISNNRIKVNVDNTIVDNQYFEISYDIFKLSQDTDYQVGFISGTGTINNLVLEIHSLSNISVVNGSGGGVQADWTEEDPDEPSYIQHKPDIMNLVEGTNITFTETEDGIQINAIVTAIPVVTGYATHNEVYETGVTAVQMATAQIPELPDTQEVQFEEINLGDYALASAIPVVTGFATHSEVYNSEVTAIQFVTALIPESEVTPGDVHDATVTAIEAVTAMIPAAQVQSDWTEEVTTDPAYILHKPTEKFLIEGDNIVITETAEGVEIAAIVTGIPTVTGFTTEAQVYNATVTAVQLATSVVPEVDELPIEAGDHIGLDIEDDKLVISVTGTFGDVTQDEVYNATVTAVQLATAQIPDLPDTEEVQFEEIDLDDYALASAIPDVTNLASKSEVFEATVTAVQLATSVTPEQVQADWAATGVDDPSYIQHKPDIVGLIEGDNIHFTETVNGIQISATMPAVSGTVTEVEVYNATVTAVQLATAQIPDISNLTTNAQVYNATVTAVQLATSVTPEQVQADWAVTATDNPAYIQHKPEILDNMELKAGEGIGISIDDGEVIVAVTGNYLTEIPDTYATKANVYNATVTAVQLATAQIPDTSDMATQTWVGEQGYLTSIPSSYATDVEVTQAVTGATQNMVSYTGTTAINHIRLVSTLPSPVDANTLYLIPEA